MGTRLGYVWHVERIEKTFVKRTVELEGSKTGKALLNYLLKPNGIKTSQISLSKLLSKSEIQGFELYSILKTLAHAEVPYTDPESLDNMQRVYELMKHVRFRVVYSYFKQENFPPQL